MSKVAGFGWLSNGVSGSGAYLVAGIRLATEREVNVRVAAYKIVVDAVSIEG